MQIRHPIWLRRIEQPAARSFAVLFAIESLSRALLATVLPLQALELLQTGQKVSALFFAVGLVGLIGTFAVPWLVRRSARRWVYTGGVFMLVTACALLALGTLTGQALGMAARVLGVVSVTICISLYIMDHIPRDDLPRAEPMRIFYSAGAWCIGPALGVFLRTEVAEWAPYAASAACALTFLTYFWILRLTDRGRLVKPLHRVPSPAANMRRFLAQPRLVLAWFLSLGRSGWWAMFFIYTPIFAVQSGLGENAGGIAVSIGTGFTFLLPLWARAVRRHGIRRQMIIGLSAGGLATLLVALSGDAAWLGIAALLLGALFVSSLDAVGNLPFMLAVKPSERPEMTAIYSTYRDASEMGPPGLFALLLRGFELPVVFVVGGCGLLGLTLIARRLNPRLGKVRDARKHPGGGTLATSLARQRTD